MALITGFPIELILLQDRLVVSPAKVTAADADTPSGYSDAKEWYDGVSSHWNSS